MGSSIAKYTFLITKLRNWIWWIYMNPRAHLQSQTDIQNLYDTCDIKSWLFHIYDAFDYILQ